MNTTLNKILMTASVLTVMAVANPAQANPSVLCSVRANYDAASGDAAYQPGVDARGKAVAPADLAAPAVIVPSALRIPLTVDLSQRLNEVLPDGRKLEAQVGVIEVKQDGKVFFNGQDLTGPATAMCDNLEKQKAAALKTADAPKARKAAVQKSAPLEPISVSDGPAIKSAPVTPVEPQVLQDTTPPAEPVPAPQAVTETPPAAVAPAAEPQAPMPTDPVPAETIPEAPAMPAPETLLNPPADTPRFPGEAVNPVEPAPDALSAPVTNDAILSPAEGGMMPRPPMDPLASEPETLPAPAPMSNDGMLSGGAQ